jgi:hypothetical protein
MRHAFVGERYPAGEPHHQAGSSRRPEKALRGLARSHAQSGGRALEKRSAA